MTEKKKGKIKRDELLGAIALVFLFAAVLIGREAGNFYSSYEELSQLKIYFEVAEEDIARYLQDVLNNRESSLEVSLTVTLPSVSNEAQILTETPDYVRRWLIGVTLSPVIVRQPSVSDVEFALLLEGETFINETFSYPQEKVSYLGLIDRDIPIEIDDLPRFREKLLEASQIYGGEIEIQVKGRVKSHLWFLDTWLPFSTTRYPFVSPPKLDLESSNWKNLVNQEIDTIDVNLKIYVSVEFNNPTRFHSLFQNITVSVYRENETHPTANITKEVKIPPSTLGVYTFQFAFMEPGSYRYGIESEAETLLIPENSPFIMVSDDS